jgi:hypothetical protein
MLSEIEVMLVDLIKRCYIEIKLMEVVLLIFKEKLNRNPSAWGWVVRWHF